MLFVFVGKHKSGKKSVANVILDRVEGIKGMVIANPKNYLDEGNYLAVMSYEGYKELLHDLNGNDSNVIPIYVYANKYSRLRRAVDDGVCEEEHSEYYKTVCQNFLKDEELFEDDELDFMNEMWGKGFVFFNSNEDDLRLNINILSEWIRETIDEQAEG
jgi:hypothetical protein